MDLTKIDEALRTESSIFQQAIQTAVDEARVRRAELRPLVVEVLGLKLNQNMSAEDFYAAMDTFKKISGNLETVLDQAGFSVESSEAWVNRTSAPNERFRLPIVQMLLDAVIDYYADMRLAHDLHAFLEEWGNLDDIKSMSNVERSLLLSRRLDSFVSYHKILSVRPANCLRFSDVETVGELVSYTEQEILRFPNIGRKSLNEIREFLVDVGLMLGCLSEDEKKDVKVRRLLNENAGHSLTTKWCAGIKPEFRDLTRHDRLHKVQNGEDPYEWSKASSDLMNTLTMANITEKTELATAPKQVLDDICEGHDGWREQLPKLLQESFTPDENGIRRWRLGLHLHVPQHLSEAVNVYHPPN